MTLQPHQQRVVDEYDELCAKLDKLTKFIKGEVFKTVEPEEQTRLERQQAAMASYALILLHRIEAFQP